MPTNKERSDVALRLRYVAEHGAPEWETIACCIADCLGENDYPLWENGDKLFDLLANLIEPEERTCGIEGIYADEFAIYDHLTCGHVNLRHCHETTSYCSTCGAKIIGG